MSFPPSLKWLEDSNEEYRKGKKALAAEQWTTAIAHFKKAYDLNNGNLARRRYVGLMAYAELRMLGAPQELAEQAFTTEEDERHVEKGALEA